VTAQPTPAGVQTISIRAMDAHATLSGVALDGRQTRARDLGAEHQHGTVGSDAGLVGRDGFRRLAQLTLMVECHRRHNPHRRGQHTRGIMIAADPRFQNGGVNSRPAKRRKCQQDKDLKKGRQMVGSVPLDEFQDAGPEGGSMELQLFGSHVQPGNPNPFGHAAEVRRREDPRPLAIRQQGRFQHRADRSLAVGPGHCNDGGTGDQIGEETDQGGKPRPPPGPSGEPSSGPLL
jgi:hypothetical protein